MDDQIDTVLHWSNQKEPKQKAKRKYEVIRRNLDRIIPGVGFMVRVVGLESKSPEFKSCLAVELIPGGVDSACHPSEVGKMSTNLLG